MINRLNNGYDKNIVCVKTICMRDGYPLSSTEWDRFFDFRVDDIENCADEVIDYLENLEKKLNIGVYKFEIILLDIYLKYGVYHE